MNKENVIRERCQEEIEILLGLRAQLQPIQQLLCDTFDIEQTFEQMQCSIKLKEFSFWFEEGLSSLYVAKTTKDKK